MSLVFIDRSKCCVKHCDAIATEETVSWWNYYTKMMEIAEGYDQYFFRHWCDVHYVEYLQGAVLFKLEKIIQHKDDAPEAVMQRVTIN